MLVCVCSRYVDMLVSVSGFICIWSWLSSPIPSLSILREEFTDGGDVRRCMTYSRMMEEGAVDTVQYMLHNTLDKM